MSKDSSKPQTIKLGDKLLESPTLPPEVEARFQQDDLACEMFYSGDDAKGHYVIAWLAERCIKTLPDCLKNDRRFQNQTRYRELTFTRSSEMMDVNFRVQFYQKFFPILYHKMQGHSDQQIVVKAYFTENGWLREIGFGPYEEVAFIPEELSVIALTSTDAEAYYQFLQGDHVEAV